LKLVLNTLLVPLLAGLVACSDSDVGNVDRLNRALAKLDETNPESDARQKYQLGDRRFAACIGEAPGPYFPKLAHEEWLEVRKTKDFWIIQGTSDAIESTKHRKLIDRAVEYAGRFNAEMLRLRVE